MPEITGTENVGDPMTISVDEVDEIPVVEGDVEVDITFKLKYNPTQLWECVGYTQCFRFFCFKEVRWRNFEFCGLKGGTLQYEERLVNFNRKSFKLWICETVTQLWWSNDYIQSRSGIVLFVLIFYSFL